MQTSLADVASLLKLSNNYALRLLFQAKLDRLYLTNGLRLQEYWETHSHVPRDMCQETHSPFKCLSVYSDDNRTHLAWEAKKRSPNRDLKWKELKKCLYLYNEIPSIEAVEKHRDRMPGKQPIGRTLFYSIASTSLGEESCKRPVQGLTICKVNLTL